MKRILASFLLLQVSLLSAADAKNLFFNGNFAEPLVNGTIPGWTTKGSIITDGSSKALRLSKANGRVPIAQQVVAVPQGIKKVKLSLMVREGSTAGAKYEIDLHALDVDKKSLTPDGKPGTLANLSQALGSAISKPSKGWKSIRFGNKVPSNAAFISLMLFATGDDGEVDFKDVVCEFSE